MIGMDFQLFLYTHSNDLGHGGSLHGRRSVWGGGGGAGCKKDLLTTRTSQPSKDSGYNVAIKGVRCPRCLGSPTRYIDLKINYLLFLLFQGLLV